MFEPKCVNFSQTHIHTYIHTHKENAFCVFHKNFEYLHQFLSWFCSLTALKWCFLFFFYLLRRRQSIHSQCQHDDKKMTIQNWFYNINKSVAWLWFMIYVWHHLARHNLRSTLCWQSCAEFENACIVAMMPSWTRGCDVLIILRQTRKA